MERRKDTYSLFVVGCTARHGITLFLCLALSPLLFAAEQPTETSLIEAWEVLQKSDPNIATFEKISDRSYKFKTTLFPFDGKLIISNVMIYNMGMESLPYKDFMEGSLKIELVGFPKELLQKYVYQYYIWARNNTLYYDKKAEKWISSHDFREIIHKIAHNKNKARDEKLEPFLYGLLGVELIIALALLVYHFMKNHHGKDQSHTA